jgi:hypothetical protein
MITPMLFSIYINTTLAHSHAAVKLRRFSLAVDLLLPGFIRRCGKTYPTRAVNFLSSKTLTVYLCFPGCPPFRLRGQTVNSCLVGYPSSIRFRRTGLILSLSVVQWIWSYMHPEVIKDISYIELQLQAHR